MDDLVAKALHAARQHFDEGGFLDSLRGMFSGPDYLSTGEVASPTNWGDPESAADFFKADRALRLAREVQASADDVTGSVPAREPLTAPRPGAVEVQELPVNIPFAAPERGAAMSTSAGPAPLSNFQTIPGAITPISSDFQRTAPQAASFATQPLAYTATPIAAPAAAAIDQATGKLTARAPQDVEQPATNAQILAAIRANESRNNPRAQNPSSSAGGLYQFINSTWGNTLRRMDPEQYGGYSDRQLRGLKTNPDAVDVQHAAANYHLTNDIAPVLSRAGVPLTPGSAYLSWFQGPGGAVKAYTAPDDATVAQVFPKTVSANANMRFNGKPYAQWTMSDLRQWADTAMAKRMGRAEGGEVDDAPTAPDGVDQALDVVRQQPVTPASLARAWTPPEEAIETNYGPRQREIMETYPEKLGAIMGSVPGAVAHSIQDPFELAHQAATNQLPPDYFHSDDGISRALNAAGLAQTGGLGGASARAGETVLGSGPVRRFTGLDLIAKDPEAASAVLSEYNLAGKNLPTRVGDVEYKYSTKNDLVPWREITPEDIYKQNGYVTSALGDKSPAGRMLHEINGVPLGGEIPNPVNQQGGGEFARSLEDPNAPWASRPGAVKGMHKKIEDARIAQNIPEDAPLFMSHTIMGNSAVDSTQMMAQSMLRQIEPLRSKISGLEAEKFDKFVGSKLPGWPGILNPRQAEAFMAADKTGTRASTLVQAFDKAGPQSGGFPNLGAARFANMDPRLVSANQLSSGFSIGRIDPRFIGPMERSHETYDMPFRGEYVGGMRYQVPAELMFPEWWKSGKLVDKNGTPTTMTNRQQALMTQMPVQRADQQWLDNIMRYLETNKRKWGYYRGGITW